MSKTATIATLLRARRPDLANQVAYAARFRKRKGSARDDADYPPDLVFDTPLDAKLYWYRPGREDESAGLYVAHEGHEWWWHDVDERKAERIADQVVELLHDAEQDESIDLSREAKRLGAQ
jgi:hypothetical protein